MTTKNDRGGFALPAATGALVIIGILVTAGFFVARQELRIGVASRHANMAVNIAQAGANEVMANWNGYQLNNIPAWSDTTLTGTSPGGEWSVTIANANNFVYFLTAEGEVTDGGALWAGARRTIGISAKILFADINPPAALLTRGQVRVGGSASIDGTNTTPPTWAPYCTDLPTNDTTGVIVDDASGGNPQVIGAGASITGNPPSEEDPTIVDETFTDFDNLTWDELTAIAQIEGKDVTGLGTTITSVQPSLTAAGRCNTADLVNWGDTIPTAPCGAYFPLIYHGGNLRLNANAYGQGVLLVEGNLELSGGFNFFGIIITQGTFSTGVGNNRVIGSVMASNAADLNETISGSSEIIYSRCAITRSVLNNAALSRARPMEIRSWVDLSAAVN
jgi:hypothetical protein